LLPALLAALLTSLPAAADDPRIEVSLNGNWECQVASELNGPPSAGGWNPCTVPGYLSGTNHQRAWLRRGFAVPAEMRGKRVKIHFGGVKFNSRVFVNGRHVGGCFGGYEPFEVDVTDAVRFDGSNELSVGCHDWTGVFAPGEIEFPQGGNWDVVRGAPRDKILSPIGGLFSLYGIWDDVTLRAHPAVYVSDVFIQPSVRRGELVVRYTLANESPRDVDVELRATVEDDGKDVLAFAATRVAVPPGKTAAVVVRQPWKDAPLWSHVDPHLLHLRTELSTGDCLRTRFGFREFWTEGHRFYLNGSRINLLATSWWPPHDTMTREGIRARWEAVKGMGCVAFRTHTQPWPSLHYEVADEVGLLMVVEGAVWNDDDTYRINDPAFWENYGRHLKAMIDRDKNRPSVILWSLENEFFGGRLNDASPAKEELIRMGRLVKQCDPTRPILYESDGDPGGVADVIGIHYPHEYPDFTGWPNEAYWLRQPAAIHHMFLNGQQEFAWRKDKPLYLGEFLWIPSRDPSWHTVFFGDEAYRDYHRYRNLAKAEAWRMQILGYRHLEVAGISPWTVIEGGPLDDTNPLVRAHRYAYQPLAAYPLDYDRRFFGGQTVVRRLAVFNDILQPSTLELEWTLGATQNEAAQGKKQLVLGPGEQTVVEVDLPMPQVSARTAISWQVSILREGKRVFADHYPIDVYPDVGFPEIRARLGLFDPNGATRNVFEARNLNAIPVRDLSGIPESVEVLVIGSETLAAGPKGVPVIGRIAPERAALDGFVNRGGRVLVLRQDAYPEGLFDAALTGHGSTMTFPAAADHPALRGIRAEDLKFWRGDHRVASAEPARPTSGGFVPIVVSGSAAGIDHAPLLEQRAGPGCLMFCQLHLVEKQAAEPAAAQLLANLLDYLAGYQGRPKKTAVVGGSDEYRAFLRSLGLQFDDLSGKLAATDLAPYHLVICRGERPEAPGLKAWVESGGHLLVHRAAADDFAALGRAWKLDLAPQAYAGPVTRSDDDDSLVQAIHREDLYWLGRHVGIDWADTPRAAEMADLVFSKTMEGKQAAAYEVEEWKLEGVLVERVPPGVVFATVGSASHAIDFPADGTYLFGLVARGTPCDGGYPLARVSVDDRPLGVVAVAGSWSTVTVLGRVSAGTHKVSIAFTNDASSPKEDRNLFVDKLLVARDADPGGVRFLTTPAAAAAARRGKGMVVIDALRWDTETQNARKAARYAAALLTRLGGDFRPKNGATISCRKMTPEPGMPFFSNQGSFASLACSGYVKTAIEVAAPGRYTMELVASGSSAQGVYPLVEVAVDGRPVGKIQLTAGSWRSYFLGLDLPAGSRELRLSFLNDLNLGGEDRNLRLDKVRFSKD